MSKNMIPPWRPLYYYTHNIRHTPHSTKTLHTLLLQYMRSAVVVLILLYIPPDTTSTTTNEGHILASSTKQLPRQNITLTILASNNLFLWQLFASYIYDERFGALVMHYQLSLCS